MSTNDSALTRPHPAGADGYAWIEGQYVPISEARIPILDTGFTRSDLTYDVVGVWEGSFFRLDDHLDRFERGWRAIRLEPPISRERMREVLIGIVGRSGLRNAYVAMIASRGVPSAGERDPRRFAGRFYAYAIPYVWVVRPEQQRIGTDVVVARDVRRTPPGAIDPTIKNFQWGDFIRALFESYDRGAWLPILTDGDGSVTEGPGFNVFVVDDGALRTPARGVLLGITRKTVIEIAADSGLEVDVGNLPTSLLYRADEIFLTTTAGGIIPVANVDGDAVGVTCPGPITERIRDTYWAWHREQRFATPVAYSQD